MGKIFLRWYKVKRGGWILIAQNNEGLWILEMNSGFGDFEFLGRSVKFAVWEGV
jgi:hypothetical protein